MEYEVQNREIPWDAIINRLQGKPGEDDGSLDRWINENADRRKLWDEIQLVWSGIRNENVNFLPDKDAAWKLIASGIKLRSAPKAKFKIPGYRQAAASCTLLIMGVFIGSLIRKNPSEDIASRVTYETRSGKSLISLPDGSRVWLNARSSLCIPGNFGKPERQVTVKGEAFFDVFHDSEMPFTVQIQDLKIKVYGTEFNVKETAGDVATTLVEGSVSLIPGTGQETGLLPGQTAFYTAASHLLDIVPADTFLVKLWAGDRLILEDQPLEKVAQALEVWFGKEIEVAPQLRTSRYYRLTVREETLEEIFLLMQKTGKFNYRYRGEKIIIY